MSNKHDVWKVRDVLGRDLSYITSCLPTLSDLQKIDLYSYELESGYTPLHVTLRKGFLRKSFLLYKSWKDEQQALHKQGVHVLNQKDREGLTPIELYNIEFQRSLKGIPKYTQYSVTDSMIYPEIIYEDDDINEEKAGGSEDEWRRRTSFMEIPTNNDNARKIRNIGGSHLLSLGSNVNAQLGTGNKDDRSNFFQLEAKKFHDTGISPFSKPLYIKRVLMSRYHSVVVNSKNEIYTCGNSNRGRLGNGETNTTVSSYTKVFELEDGMKDISISNHHNLVVDGNGNVYSWGWNIYHQLGYSTGNRNKESIGNLHKSTPKRIPFLEDENIKLVACSKIHSCALTESNKLYLWGLNVGQLGSSKSTHIEFDTQYNNVNGYVVMSPIIMDLSHLDIEQIICTEFFTFIRSSGNNLTVLSNFSNRAFKIPHPKNKHRKKVDIFSHYVPKTIPTQVVDMKCSNSFGNHICFKYADGKIGKLVLKNEGVESWSKLPNELPISALWTPNLPMNKCMDFSACQTGNVILCTFGGEVFMTQGGKFEKVHSGKLITGRVVSVCSDSSFGSFAFLKQDFIDIPVKFPQDSFYNDFFRYSPYYEPLGNTLEYGLLGLDDPYKLANDDPAISNDTTAKADLLKTVLATPTKAQIESSLYDTLFFDEDGTLLCKSFMALLFLRCKKFIDQLIEQGSYTISQDLIFTGDRMTNGIFKIIIHDKTVTKTYQNLPKDLLHSILTGSKPTNQQINMTLLSIIDDGLHSIRLDTYLNYYASIYIFNELLPQSKTKGRETTDTILLLQDGTMPVHSFVLAARCPYFSSLFNHSAYLSTDHTGNFLVDFSEYTISQISMLIRYIYGSDIKSDIRELITNTEISLIDTLIDSLILADTFCMESFKFTLEAILSKYISGSTVVHILVFAARTNSAMLMSLCSIFIGIHVGVLFAGENLEIIDKYFDKQIWELIESNIQNLKKKQDLRFEWYYNNKKDWRSLFVKNISNFNNEFINVSSPIIPVFDIQPATVNDTRRKNSTSNRRRSSVYQKIALDEPIPAFINKTDSATVFRNVWETQEPTSSILKEESDFIKVGKRSKKRTPSNSISPPTTTPTKTTTAVSDVVIHKSLENSETSLPSLLSNGKLKSTSKSSNKDENLTKKSISFKKTTQKERLKTTIKDEDANKQSQKNKKGPWELKATEQKDSNNNLRRNSEVNSLPSLNDQLRKEDLKPKKKNQRKYPSKQPVEFVSSGNHAGITPYLTTGKIESTLPNNHEPSWTATSASDFKEKLEAQEFEKWFQEESERIQRELNKQGKSHQDELSILYKSAQNIPNFVDNSQKNSKRKIKGKFKAKIKVNAGNINENII
ncbi:hypothetical protein RNJ44_00659 [Nakaseomyces bracarensis]|uniref:BTB domain-containing protein n=1 Tax=Nakaseomyces bracarensis TaxID=273131 RepID=A0ABR4NRR9_9SACH